MAEEMGLRAHMYLRNEGGHNCDGLGDAGNSGKPRYDEFPSLAQFTT
jgi:hypothetical protein